MLSDLALRLAERGAAVAIVTSRQLYENAAARLPSHEVVGGVEVWRIATTSLGRGSLIGRALDYATFHLSAALRLARLLQPGDVVIAKTDPPLISVIVCWVARWRGAVLVNWLQDLFPEVATALSPRAMPLWLEALMAGARDHSLQQAAMNIAIGERMAARLTQRGIAQDRIRVIPNWADCETVVPLDTQRSAARLRLGLTNHFVIGYSGNFGRAHEFETLIAAARLLSDDPQIAFLMTGGGARNAPLQAAVERAGLCSFHFQGYQPAPLLSDSLAAADVHLVSLLPAVEGLIVPSKVYGILAAGRPVVFVGDPAGEIATLIRQHGCGIAVAVGEGRRLASVLQELQADPDRLAAMGASARRLAIASYSSERAANEWVKLLEEIAHAPLLMSHT